jgi:hypothetical protein
LGDTAEATEAVEPGKLVKLGDDSCGDVGKLLLSS